MKRYEITALISILMLFPVLQSEGSLKLIFFVIQSICFLFTFWDVFRSSDTRFAVSTNTHAKRTEEEQ